MEPPKKIFLCWSKDRSKAIAQAWAKLLPEIVTGKPILSIEFQKGREWSAILRKDLDEAKTGIVFLTPENLASPWLHFEAGALATAVGRRNGDVFTYIYGFDPGKLAGPLSAYQSTVAAKEDTWRLVRDLCAAMECEPPPEEVYSKCWAKLEGALEEIPAPAITELVPGFVGLFDRKTFQEPLPDCTNQMAGPVRRRTWSPYGAQGSSASGRWAQPVRCAETVPRSHRRGGWLCDGNERIPR